MGTRKLIKFLGLHGSDPEPHFHHTLRLGSKMIWAERQEDEFPGDVSASKAAAEVGSSVWIPLVPGSTQ